MTSPCLARECIVPQTCNKTSGRAVSISDWSVVDHTVELVLRGLPGRLSGRLASVQGPHAYLKSMMMEQFRVPISPASEMSLRGRQRVRVGLVVLYDTSPLGRV